MGDEVGPGGKRLDELLGHANSVAIVTSEGDAIGHEVTLADNKKTLVMLAAEKGGPERMAPPGTVMPPRPAVAQRSLASGCSLDDGWLGALATAALPDAGEQDRPLLLTKMAASAPAGAPTSVAAAPVDVVWARSRRRPCRT